MPGLNLKNLKDYRDEILKVEVVSLLALWDKVDPDKQNKADINLHGTKSLSDWEDVLKNKTVEILAENFDLWDDFLSEWRKWRSRRNKNFLLQVLYGIGESLNSGIDKGSPRNDVKVMPENERWIANPFGSFKKKIIYLQWNESCINNKISGLKKFVDVLLDLDNICWENITIVKRKIEEIFAGLLSDDRFPANEVSLWDQAYMATTMFKASLIEYVLNNNTIQDLPEKNKIKWRILGIQYDKLGLSERGYKPAQIQWYRETAKDIDEEIKKLLEYDYPIGNEIYRDETGIYFLIGEKLGEDVPGDNVGRLHPDLNEINERILDIFKDKSLDEFYPAIFVTKASRGLVNLGYLVEKARENFLKADWRKKDIEICIENSETGKAVGICQLCGQRMVFESNRRDEYKYICYDCYENKTRGRIDKWLEDTTKESIWMDELKDVHGRVALVTMKFELKHWLNGDMLNGMVLQKNINLANDVISLKEDLIDIYNNQDKVVQDTVLKNYTDKAIHGLQIKNRKVIESLLLERSIGDRWEEFIYKKLHDWDDRQNTPLKQKIDFDNRKINWSRLTDQDVNFLSTILLQFLLRKNPSPARLRRVWESTKEFFEEIERNICDYAGIPEERRKRYYWDNSGIPEGEYRDGDAIFWSDQKNVNKVYLISYLKDLPEAFRLKEYARRDSDEGKEHVGELQLRDGKRETYQPYMSITDPTPVSWQFIIPAEYVPNLIDNVIKKYNEHFRFVYGKLPLHIGVVIQDYKKPLYVGIKALRRIRRDIEDVEKLEINVKASQIKDKLKCQRLEELLNDTQSYYSLYWGEHNKGYEFYVKPAGTQGYHRKWICAVGDIGDDESVCIIPNTFDFEFLDTNRRRNDIYYARDFGYKRVAEIKNNRPYEIEIFWEKFKVFRDVFGEDKYSTRLQKLVSMIYGKLDFKDDSLATFMASAFINTLELKKDERILKMILQIFDIEEPSVRSDGKLDTGKLYRQLTAKLNRENLKLFLDMFEFWHRTLKEV